MKLPRRSLVPFLCPLALLAAPALHSAQAEKLNGPLARPQGGDLFEFEVSPDGTRVVYLADQATDNVAELFVTKPGPGSPALRLAGPQVAGGSVWDFWIGPRGQRVVLIGRLLDLGATELFSVPIDGGVLQRLSAPMPLGGSVVSSADSVQITPDETRVVYLADQDVNNQTELYSVPIAGGTPVQLNLELPGQQVRSFRLSPDGTHVLFRALQPSTQVNELFAVPVTGGRAVKLGPEGRDTGLDFLIDGSNARAVLSARTGVANKVQLYARPLDGSGAPLALLAESVNSVGMLRSNPDGSRVVCTLGVTGETRVASARTDGGGTETLDVVPGGFLYPTLTLTPDGATAVYVTIVPGVSTHLRRAGLDGSAPAAEIALVNGGEFALSPDGQRVAYASGNLSVARLDLATPPLELTPELPARIAFGSLGQRVVFASRDANGAGPLELFSVPASGAEPPTPLSPPFVFGGSLASSPALAFRVSALGRVVYVADQLEDERHELFEVPVGGGMSVRLSAEMPIGPIEGDVFEHVATPDGLRVVYLADERQNDRPELFSVRTDASAAPVSLSPLEEGEVVTSFAVTPDGSTAVYWLDRPGLEDELHAVPGEGGPSLRLFGPGQGTPPIALDPSGRRALFSTRSGTTAELSSVEIDGLSAPLLLDSGEAFGPIRFTPDGRQALYLVVSGGESSLRSVPTDGSTPARALDDGAAPTSNAYSVTPDGTQALYLASGSSAGQIEAFVVPLDASAPPRRLNPPLPALGDVVQVGAVGDFAFYRANQDSPEQRELYRVPLDGSAPALKLNAPLVAGGNVTLFEVTPDGSRVVYQADQELDERYELYGAPADGSGPVVKLNPPVGQGDVGGDTFFDDLFRNAFLLSPDGTLVAFRADATRRGARELFVTPVDGSAPARRVSRPASTGDTVLGDYRFAGSEVVFVAAEEWIDGGRAVSVFHAPIDARHPAKRLGTGSIAALPRRPVTPLLTVLPQAARVVFRLDVESPSVIELFSAMPFRRSPLDGPPTRSLTRPR